jgi:hypothetical protein
MPLAGTQPERFIKNNKYHVYSNVNEWQRPRRNTETKQKLLFYHHRYYLNNFGHHYFPCENFLSPSTYLTKYKFKFAHAYKVSWIKGSQMKKANWLYGITVLTSRTALRKIIIQVCFMRVRKISKSNCQLRHVSLSVVSSLRINNSVPTRWIFVKFDILKFLENVSSKFKL